MRWVEVVSRVVCSLQPVHGIAWSHVRTYVACYYTFPSPPTPHPSPHPPLPLTSHNPHMLISLPLPVPTLTPCHRLSLLCPSHPPCNPHTPPANTASLSHSPPLPSPSPVGVQGRHLSRPVRVQCGTDPLEGLPPLPWLPQPPQAGHPGPLQGIWAVSWVTQRREEGEGGGFGTTPGGWGVCTTLL